MRRIQAMGALVGSLGLLSASSALSTAAAAEPAFVNVAAPGSTFESPGGGRGALALDYDNDGDLDLLVASSVLSFDPVEDRVPSLTLLRNDGLGRFVDATVEAGIDGDWRLATFGITAADVNNDGWLDLFLGNGGKQTGLPPDILYINYGGFFADETAVRGLDAGSSQTFVGVWLDADNDSYVDLLRVGYNRTPTRFYRNVDGEYFEDVSEAWGIGQLVISGQGASTGDVNNDGFIDVYIPTLAINPNVLLINEGGQGFSDQAALYGVDRLPASSYASSIVDLNNDGWMDLAVAGYSDIRSTSFPELSRLFLNVPAPELGPGRRRLRDITLEAGFYHRLNELGAPVGGGAMGLQTGDFDLDGLQDLYVANGGPFDGMAEEDLLFENLGPNGPSIRVRNVTHTLVNPYQEAGASSVHMSHGVVFFDYDDDGDVDIYVNSGGPGVWSGQEGVGGQANSLWRNDAAGRNNYIRIALEGQGVGGTNRAAIGVRVQVSAPAHKPLAHQTLEIKGANGFGQQNSLWLTAGLGRYRSCDIVVTWTTGETEVYRGIPAGQRVRIVENGGLYADDDFPTVDP